MSTPVEEVSPHLYRVSVPLPGSPLKALNSYVITGGERPLVVDTGWNHERCMRALRSGLDELGIDLRNADFFITHLHSDHTGLVSQLASDTAGVYFGKADAELRKRIDSCPSKYRNELTTYARMHGFPDAGRALSGHPGRRYSSRSPATISTLAEGDTITVGDYSLKCIETPGHTRGHICLYEPDRKILIAGDHVLVDITPNITSWSDEGNPLKQYMSSLDKVYELDVDLVLPGHRRVFRNHRERIEQLKHHHQERLDEVVSILENGQRTAYQVASQMSWDMTYDSWDVFPLPQKWFALGEALSHLRYLEEEGQVQNQARDGVVVYWLT